MLIRKQNEIKIQERDHIGFDKKMGHDRIGFKTLRSKIYQNVESVIGYVNKNALHRCNCRPVAGDPEKLS